MTSPSPSPLPTFTFRHVDAASRSLVHEWLAQPHVAQWYYGDGLANTIRNLDAFLRQEEDPFDSQYWLAYLDQAPFAFLITSRVGLEDPYRKWCSGVGSAITLDILIGESAYLGRGLSVPLIRAFLRQHFSKVEEVLIDPEASNERAVHVYEKLGFKKLGEFIPTHSPHPHCMMRLSMDQL